MVGSELTLWSLCSQGPDVLSFPCTGDAEALRSLLAIQAVPDLVACFKV